MEGNNSTVVSDCFINMPNNTFRAAGVAIPVFSLRSRNGLGVGEFNDLKALVDWAKKVGLKLIQVLPVNDTIATYTKYDSYPYAAVSAFALHPLYLNLQSIIRDRDNLNKFLQTSLEKLNSSATVEYSEVLSEKLAVIKKIFSSEKKQVFESDDFRSFFNTNSHWLIPYGAFSYFRDLYKTPDFNEWPEHRNYNEQEINNLASSPEKAPEEISIYYFIQYHLHVQLKEANDYAHSNGIILKGDIPIGIYTE